MSRNQGVEVYHTATVQAWEKRWFAANNSSFGLMQQAAFLCALKIITLIEDKKLLSPLIRVWCGQGNNGGDGYFIATYLAQRDYQVEIIAIEEPKTADAIQASKIAQHADIDILQHIPLSHADVHIDALYGIGLNRELNENAQHLIHQFNATRGLKIAIDIPSGLDPNTGVPLPVAVKADHTYSFIGLKTGLVIGQAQYHVGHWQVIPLIPKDDQVITQGYFKTQLPVLAPRLQHQHKGSFGHVLVIGGHPQMGGAVIMAAEAAIHSGSGKVTVLCDAKHHSAIVARSPNIMLKNIQQTDVTDLVKTLKEIDVVCFGMGLGRDAWGEQNYHMVLNALKQSAHLKHVIWDADALWFLALHPNDISIQPTWIFTPHSGEAARLLQCSIAEVEYDRIAAIYKLQQQYGGQWVLKGAGSLSLEDENLSICGLGNAGMGTAGMGDVLAGMMASLKGQFDDEISVADVVLLHAATGDILAQHGQRGLQAHDMSKMIYQVVNHQG